MIMGMLSKQMSKKKPAGRAGLLFGKEAPLRVASRYAKVRARQRV
jgi:hypothetical protein